MQSEFEFGLNVSRDQIVNKWQKLIDKEFLDLHQKMYDLQGPGAWTLLVPGEGHQFRYMTKNDLFYLPIDALSPLLPDDKVINQIRNIKNPKPVPLLIINFYSWIRPDPRSGSIASGLNSNYALEMYS